MRLNVHIGKVLRLIRILSVKVVPFPAYQKHSPHPLLGGRYTLVRGERLNGIQEVSGSIPLISTKRKDIRRMSFLFSYASGRSAGSAPGRPRFPRGQDQHHGPAQLVGHAGHVHQSEVGPGLHQGSQDKARVQEGPDIGGQGAVILDHVAAQETGRPAPLGEVVIHRPV